MIKLNVAAIKKNLVGELSFQFDLEPSELNLTPKVIDIIGTIRVDGTIENAGDVLLLEANLRAQVRRQCARCLKVFETQTEALVEEKYYPAGTENIEKDAYTYEFDVVDITEALREGLLLVEPIKALCKKDCKGLCPSCGADRNIKDCGCDVRSVDPRLAALQNIKLD